MTNINNTINSVKMGFWDKSKNTAVKLSKTAESSDISINTYLAKDKVGEPLPVELFNRNIKPKNVAKVNIKKTDVDELLFDKLAEIKINVLGTLGISQVVNNIRIEGEYTDPKSSEWLLPAHPITFKAAKAYVEEHPEDEAFKAEYERFFAENGNAKKKMVHVSWSQTNADGSLSKNEIVDIYLKDRKTGESKFDRKDWRKVTYNKPLYATYIKKGSNIAIEVTEENAGKPQYFSNPIDASDEKLYMHTNKPVSVGIPMNIYGGLIEGKEVNIDGSTGDSKFYLVFTPIQTPGLHVCSFDASQFLHIPAKPALKEALLSPMFRNAKGKTTFDANIATEFVKVQTVSNKETVVLSEDEGYFCLEITNVKGQPSRKLKNSAVKVTKAGNKAGNKVQNETAAITVADTTEDIDVEL